MKVWEVNSACEGYYLLEFSPSLPDELSDFFGESIADKWKPCKLKKVKFDPHQRNLKLGDASGMETLIISQKALKVLKPIIENDVEILPVNFQDKEKGKYHVINVTALLDCLDLENCDLKLFDDGSVMHIRKYSFFTDKIEGHNIFKTEKASQSRIFVTDEFYNAVIDNDLSSFNFRLRYEK